MLTMRQLLVGAAVLAAVSFLFSGQTGYFLNFSRYLVTNLSVLSQPSFGYYKLSLTWPPSACSTPPPGMQCANKPKEMFIIHGLWPQLPGDVPVSPYNIDRTCTNTRPTPEADLAQKLVSIDPKVLTANWPSLFTIYTDLDFWKHEWSRHGMCSDYPSDPASYFKSALTLHNNFINLPTGLVLTLIQPVLGITLGVRYKAGDVLEMVKAKFKVYPQIACNNKVGNTAQLWEIRFCYKRNKPPTVLQDCPCRLTGCEYHTQITLPRA